MLSETNNTGKNKQNVKYNLTDTAKLTMKKKNSEAKLAKNEYLSVDQYERIQNWLQNQPKAYKPEQEPISHELKLAHERRNITVRNVSKSQENDQLSKSLEQSQENDQFSTSVEQFLRNLPEYHSPCPCCDVDDVDNSYENAINTYYTIGTYV